MVHSTPLCDEAARVLYSGLVYRTVGCTTRVSGLIFAWGTNFGTPGSVWGTSQYNVINNASNFHILGVPLWYPEIFILLGYIRVPGPRYPKIKHPVHYVPVCQLSTLSHPPLSLLWNSILMDQPTPMLYHIIQHDMCQDIPKHM